MMRNNSEDPECGDNVPAAQVSPVPLEMQRSLARTVTSPEANAADAVVQFSGVSGTPFARGLHRELAAQIAAIQSGNLARPAAVLAAHVETLNAMFYALTRSAFEYRGGPHQDEKVKLAMRVQARLEASIRALVDIKSPRPMAYVQQANIGNAVQVNNGSQAIEKPPTELLEQQRHEWLDATTAATTSTVDPQLEAVAAFHGAEVERG